MDSATEIKNLLYRYAELIDSGDFKGIGELFGDAFEVAAVDQLGTLSISTF